MIIIYRIMRALSRAFSLISRRMIGQTFSSNKALTVSPRGLPIYMSNQGYNCQTLIIEGEDGYEDRYEEYRGLVSSAPMSKRICRGPTKADMYAAMVGTYQCKDRMGYCLYAKFPELFREDLARFRSAAGNLTEDQKKEFAYMQGELALHHPRYLATQAYEWLEDFPDLASYTSHCDYNAMRQDMRVWVTTGISASGLPEGKNVPAPGYFGKPGSPRREVYVRGGIAAVYEYDKSQRLADIVGWEKIRAAHAA